MTINTVGSAGIAAANAVARPNTEAREIGTDRDGDSDDASSTLKTASAVPTVNAVGERLGAVISTKA
jgi:hypothetical protein